MFIQDLRAETYSVIGCDCSVCPNLQRQLIVVSNLTDTRILHQKVYSCYRCENTVYRKHTDWLIVFFVFVCTNIAAALVDCDLHIQLTACATGKCCDMMFGIQNLNITVTFDIGTLYFTFAFHVNVSNLRLIAFACIFDRKTFQIQNDFCNVFFYAGNHAKFMKYTINFHIAYCSTGQRGQQDSSQGVAQSRTIASFQGFYNKLTVCAIGCHFSNFNARFFKFKHSFKPPFFMIECRRAYSPTALPLTSLHNR